MLRKWQSSGKVRLGRMLLDAIEVVRDALPFVKNAVHRAEIENYLEGGAWPSDAAMRSLEAAVIASQIAREKK